MTRPYLYTTSHTGISEAKSWRPELVKREPKLIAIVILPHVRSLDLIAIAEIFSEANRLVQDLPRYTVQLVSIVEDYEAINHSGLFTYTAVNYQDLSQAVDTLIVIGPDKFVQHGYEDEVIKWLLLLRGKTRRMVSISSGTLLMADAGLLNGRRVATHWRLQDQVSRNYSSLQLVRDVLYVRDGDYYTCAGATAAIDLTLTLVEEDYGLQIANDVARSMLLHLRRTGDTRQVSVTLEAQGLQPDRIADLLAWLPDNLKQDLSIKNLAKRSAMSPRNFARLFKREVGVTPAKHIDSLRLEAAQRQLRYSGLNIDGVAQACGFPSSDTLRRLFLRRLNVAPGRYRSSAAHSVANESSV